MKLMKKEKDNNIFAEEFQIKHTFSKGDDLYEIEIQWVHDLGVEYPQVFVKKNNNENICDEELITKDNKELHKELSHLIESMLELLKSKI